MMALFIVLWLMNTNKPVREAIAGYFKDPSGTLNKTDSSHSQASENPVAGQRQYLGAEDQAGKNH